MCGSRCRSTHYERRIAASHPKSSIANTQADDPSQDEIIGGLSTAKTEALVFNCTHSTRTSSISRGEVAVGENPTDSGFVTATLVGLWRHRGWSGKIAVGTVVGSAVAGSCCWTQIRITSALRSLTLVVRCGDAITFSACFGVSLKGIKLCSARALAVVLGLLCKNSMQWMFLRLGIGPRVELLVGAMSPCMSSVAASGAASDLSRHHCQACLG